MVCPLVMKLNSVGLMLSSQVDVLYKVALWPQHRVCWCVSVIY